MYRTKVAVLDGEFMDKSAESRLTEVYENDLVWILVSWYDIATYPFSIIAG